MTRCLISPVKPSSLCMSLSQPPCTKVFGVMQRGPRARKNREQNTTSHGSRLCIANYIQQPDPFLLLDLSLLLDRSSYTHHTDLLRWLCNAYGIEKERAHRSWPLENVSQPLPWLQSLCRGNGYLLF